MKNAVKWLRIKGLKTGEVDKEDFPIRRADAMGNTTRFCNTAGLQGWLPDRS